MSHFTDALIGQANAYALTQRLLASSEKRSQVIGKGASMLLRSGDPFYWSEDVCSLLRGSVASLPEFKLKADVCETSAGFFWFNSPFEVTPIAIPEDNHWEEVFRQRAGGVRLRAIAWALKSGFPNPDVTRAEVFRLTSESPAPDSEQLVKLMAVGFSDIGQPELAALGRPPNTPLISRSSPYRIFSWGLDQSWVTEDDEELNEIARILLSCMLFTRERILKVSHVRAPRSFRRSIARVSENGDEPAVQVVTLRRIERPRRPQDPEPVDWQWQWVVRGHWRMHWYPSTKTHRPKWITPYLKGPLDKPLKPAGQRVFAVVR